MRGELFFDDFAAPSSEQRRLAICMALGAAIVMLVLMLVEWPPPGALVRLIPPVLKVRLEHGPAGRERGGPAAETPPAPAEASAGEPAAPAALQREDAPATSRPAAPPAAAAVPQERLEPVVVEQPATRPAAGAEHSAPAASGPALTSAPVDWYAELERVAAAVGAQAAAEPGSMHPEFDELRRIAKLRYGPPKTNPPPPAWEAVKDPYGRKLLKNGPFFMVLEDNRLFNQEAFEKFERHMIFVAIPLGRSKPSNLPWVEKIRERYAYFLEPDELPPLKAAAAKQALDPR